MNVTIRAETARKVLIVDDDQDGADSLAMLLAEHGHEAHASYSSEQAEHDAQDFEPEVALLDLGLPKKSGLILGKELKARFPGCLLVAISGHTAETVVDQARNAGFDHYLFKPADISRILDLLDSSKG